MAGLNSRSPTRELAYPRKTRRGFLSAFSKPIPRGRVLTKAAVWGFPSQRKLSKCIGGSSRSRAGLAQALPSPSISPKNRDAFRFPNTPLPGRRDRAGGIDSWDGIQNVAFCSKGVMVINPDMTWGTNGLFGWGTASMLFDPSSTQRISVYMEFTQPRYDPSKISTMEKHFYPWKIIPMTASMNIPSYLINLDRRSHSRPSTGAACWVT